MRRRGDRIEDVISGFFEYLQIMLILSAAGTMYAAGGWNPIVEWLTTFGIYVGVGIVMGLLIATYYKISKKRMSRLDIMEKLLT